MDDGVVSGRAEGPARISIQADSRWETFLIDFGVALLILVLPHDIASDGYVRFQALSDLIEHGEISRVAYSLVGPLFSAPLYLLGTLWLTPSWWCAHYNSLVLVGGLIAASRLMREVDPRLLRKGALLVLAASMFPNHLRGYFGEVFTAVLVATGVLGLRFGRPVWGWTAIVIGVANTPAALLGLGFIAMKHAWDTRRWRHLVAIPAAVALILAEAWFRRGGPFVSGYEGSHGAATLMPYSGRPGFSYPLFLGVMSILFSFGKGLVFFAPGLVLPLTSGTPPLDDRLRSVQTLWLMFLLGLVLVYAKWWAWYGGWFWGPRFFLIASVPASLAIAARLQQARSLSTIALAGVLLALTLSAWVGIDGAVFDQMDLGKCLEDAYALEMLCWYVPEFSVLWHPFVARLRVPPGGPRIVAAYCAIVYVWLAAPLALELIRRALHEGARR